MKKIKLFFNKIKDVNLGETLETIVRKIKEMSLIKLIIVGVILVILPYMISFIILIAIIIIIFFKNIQFKKPEIEKCPDSNKLSSIKDLVIVTSEKIKRSEYSISIYPNQWEATLGKVSNIKIIYEDTNLGKMLHAYVIYENGDKNKIILPPKAYLLEQELKELVLI